MSSDKQSLQYLVWTILNLTVVLFSIALSFDIIRAVDDRSERSGAMAEYLIYNFGTSALWVVEIALNTYEKWKNSDLSAERNSIMVEGFASIYFVYDSIDLMIKWKLNKEDLSEPLFEVVVNIISYSYLSVSSLQAYYKAKREYKQIQEEPISLAV